jgi:hypothetical protein
MTRVLPPALDAVAHLISQTLGLAEVMRAPIAGEPEDDGVIGAGLVAALSEGQSTQLGHAMGALKPYEMEHRAALELLAVGGDDNARARRIAEALESIEAAILADPTIGGRVDYAELEEPDPTDTERFYALSAVLTLTYTAPTALG